MSDGDHQALASEMLARWEKGESKSRLELEYWDDATSHGKAFSAYVRKWLDVETERTSAQSERIAELEEKLRVHGISPDDPESVGEDYQLVAACREAAMAAIRVYNDPTAGFRTETFTVLMIIAWNALCQAMLHRRDIDYHEYDDSGAPVLIDGRPKVRDTASLVSQALEGAERAAMRANIDFFVGLRNLISHRYLPAVDIAVVSEAQALLLNLEKVLTEQFGTDARLGNRLAVPLQLSEFHDTTGMKSIKDLQARLPPDVIDFLDRHRKDLPEDIVRNSEYALQIFFVPVAANRKRAAEAVVRFVNPGALTPELEEMLQQMAVVTKPKRVAVASDDLMRPSDVVHEVASQLPHRFTMDTHTRCWKYFKVRPPTGAGERTATDDRYCVYDSLSSQYGYKKAWVRKLIKELKDLDFVALTASWEVSVAALVYRSHELGQSMIGDIAPFRSRCLVEEDQTGCLPSFPRGDCCPRLSFTG